MYKLHELGIAHRDLSLDPQKQQAEVAFAWLEASLYCKYSMQTCVLAARGECIADLKCRRRPDGVIDLCELGSRLGGVVEHSALFGSWCHFSPLKQVPREVCSVFTRTGPSLDQGYQIKLIDFGMATLPRGQQKY